MAGNGDFIDEDARQRNRAARSAGFDCLLERVRTLHVCAMGAFVAKALTLKTGQTHVQRYLEPLMKLIVDGKIDPGFLITHRVGLEDGPEAYKTFRDEKDGCIKVVINPSA